MKAIVLLMLASACVPAYADSLLPKGTKVTLNVEYVYESAGKKVDKYDPQEWQISRVAKLTTQLSAAAPMPLPAMHPLEAAQTANLNRKQERGAEVQKTMAPMQADIEKLMAKCGDNEKCLEAEIAKYGMAMQMTPAMKSAQKEVADITKPDAPRYQLWQSTTQSGAYSIDEKYHALNADPLCDSKPNRQCTRDETRKGAGPLASQGMMPKGTKPDAGYAAIEIDSTKNTMLIALPVPMLPLPYTKTVTTNHPEEKSGTTPQLLSFPRLSDKPISIAINGAVNGDFRQQSGQQVIAIKGAGAEGGTMTVRWKLSIP